MYRTKHVISNSRNYYKAPVAIRRALVSFFSDWVLHTMMFSASCERVSVGHVLSTTVVAKCFAFLAVLAFNEHFVLVASPFLNFHNIIFNLLSV